MNKKAKNRIFNTVMATVPEYCKNNFRYQNRLKKLILMRTQGKYTKHTGRMTEDRIIRGLSYNPEEAKRWHRTPEQIKEDAKLEQSIGLLCGNPNTK